MNQMIVFLETPLFSHILLDLSRGSHNLLSYVLLSDCLYGDCGILSHEKKLSSLFRPASQSTTFSFSKDGTLVEDKKLLTPSLPFQAKLLRSGEVFIQRFIMGSDPIAQCT